MRRVVVTGIGAITPVGNNAKELWESIKQGKCGIGPITNYDVTGRKVTLAAEVKNYNPDDYLDPKESRRMDRFTQFAMIAAKEALEDSGFTPDEEEKDRCGVIISSGIGGLGTIENEHSKGLEKNFDRVSPFFIPMSIGNMAAGQVAIMSGFKGICNCVVTACAGGTSAVGDSFHYIRDGYGEVMLCGGAEASITSLGMGGFTSMKALCTATDAERASIPFDKERSGFVMGEGAGMLMLEEYEHAVNRGAHIYCEIIGYGANCDANHVTAPIEDGSMAAKCMEMAIKDADISITDIQYINAHGTSTHLNDICETNAIKKLFGENANKLMVSSTKSMTGHLLGATGAVEAIITALALKDSYVPATINYKVSDEDCDLDIVPNEGRNIEINYALSDSLGFGGHNAAIVLKRS